MGYTALASCCPDCLIDEEYRVIRAINLLIKDDSSEEFMGKFRLR
jgi:hypothetical protein